jgi:hypothetical protein
MTSLNLITSLNYGTNFRSDRPRRTTPPFARTIAKTISETTTAPSAKNGSKQDSERIYACIRAPKNSTANALRHSCPGASVTQASALGSAKQANSPYLSAGMCAKLNYGESYTFDTRDSASERSIFALPLLRRKTRPRLRNNYWRFFCRSLSPITSRRASHQEKQKQITPSWASSFAVTSIPSLYEFRG